MNDLVEAYMTARFGKAAAVPPKYSLEQMKADPKLRQLRDQIERSMNTERQLRGEAGEGARWAQSLATKQRSGFGKALDVVRAALPSASESPAVGTGVHAALGLGGAAAGGLLQRFGQSTRGLARSLSLEGVEKAFGKGTKVEEMARALPGRFTKERLPFLSRGSKVLSEKFKDVMGARSLGKGGLLRRLFRGRGGAIAGTLAGIAIPTLMNYSRTSRLRSVGGLAGVRAIKETKLRLQKAEMLQRWRSAQLAGLESGGTLDVPYPDFLKHAPNVDIDKSMQPLAP